MSLQPSHASKLPKPLLIGIIVFCVLCVIVFFLAILFVAVILMDESIPNPMLDTAEELGGATRPEVHAVFGQPDGVIGSAELYALEPAEALLPGYYPIPLRVFDALEVYRIPANVSNADQSSDQTSDRDDDLSALVFYYDSSGVVFLVAFTHPVRGGSEKLHDGVRRSTRSDDNMYY